MGLDMFLYRGSRIPDDIFSRFEGQNIRDLKREYPSLHAFTGVFKESDGLGLHADLMPYARKATVNVTKFDMPKFRRDKGVPQDAMLVGIKEGSDRIVYAFAGPDPDERICTQIAFRGGLPDEYAEVETTHGEIEEKYTFSTPTEMYFVFLEELCYWRKKYELRNKIRAVGKDMENLGMYKVSEEMFDTIKGGIDLCSDGIDGMEGIPFVDDGDAALFYHESY